MQSEEPILPESDELAADLHALANEQRLRLLRLLTRPRYGEEIATELGMTRQSALRHIQLLVDRGFVRSLPGQRATGPVVEYQVVPQRLFALGVEVNNLGRLQPVGGPLIKRSEPTMHVKASDPPALEQPGIGHASVEPLDVQASARLLVVSGPSAGSAVPLDNNEGAWTIGREKDRHLSLANDPFVSARHAEIHASKGGHTLVDAHSANGTFLNFKKLPTGGILPLRPGDVIGIGHTCIVYQRE